ncbi:sensor histidine kinase [Pseudonocardia hierapolitana]|nr:ATP-binding protein [Pseudonocardia hierapolitana]
MQTSAPIGPPEEGTDRTGRAVNRLLAYLPRGNTLDDKSWQRRHRLLKWVLAIHVPAMAVLGLALQNTPLVVGYTLLAPVGFLVLGHVLRTRRLASFCVTGGLVFCSAGLVVLTSGSIEAHFHFFIIIGFIALYQDWVPFLWNVGFTFLSHGIGTIWLGGLIFSHAVGQANPWLWSFIHGIAVLFACVGMVIFWRITEDEQTEKEALGRQLITADAEIGRRRFTSEMLVNLARRNQSMLYRQLDIINQLEEKERDPDALSQLFTLDHLATRVRRNAESLLVLAGEQPPRTWSAPVPLRDVVRAAIAETEDLDRVVFAIDDRIAVSGASVADLTHLVAELTENAVRFSPPDTAVTIRARPDRRDESGYLLTIEDWGVGMPPADLIAANELLASPREVDLAVAQRLGFHVVARLAARHGISVSLGNTPGSGVTAVVALPAALFATAPAEPVLPLDAGVTEARPYVTGQVNRREPRLDNRPLENTGWVEPVSTTGAIRSVNGSARGPWTAVPTETVGSNRHGLDGAPDGGWRGWWNPESAGSPTRHSDRQPVGNGDGDDRGHGDGPAAAATRGSDWHPSPTPRERQALPAVPSRASTPEAGDADVPDDPDIPTPRRNGEAVTANGKPELRRRVPQAHLAPELRQATIGDTDAEPQIDGAAASALSRYQASRQAAQAVVDETGTAGGMRK